MFVSKLKSRFAAYRNNPANSSPAIVEIKKRFGKHETNKNIDITVPTTVSNSNSPLLNGSSPNQKAE